MLKTVVAITCQGRYSLVLSVLCSLCLDLPFGGCYRNSFFFLGSVSVFFLCFMPNSGCLKDYFSAVIKVQILT